MVNESPDEGELELLLTQLLRMLSPAFTAGDTSGKATAKGGDVDGQRSPARGAVTELPAAWRSDATDGSSAATSAPEAPALESPALESPALEFPAAESQGHGAAVAERPAPSAGPVPAVSSSEARALIQLVAARGIAQGELAALLGLDKSTVSRLAAGLERKGWVRRGRDEGNQRYVRLYLTPEGGDVAARVWKAWQSRQARILAALSPDERAGLSAGLGGLVRGLAAEGLLTERSGHGHES